jgi:uncharacterized phage protein gp47/JayE
MSGVTPNGFEIKTLAEIDDEIADEMRSEIAADLDLTAVQPLGQAKSIFAKKAAEIWEVLQAIVNALNPDANEGVHQDNVCAITGTKRKAATKSRVTCTVTLNASTTLPAGSIANVAGQETNRWISVADVTSTSAGTYPAVFESETAGPFVANAGTLTVITVPVSGWTAVTNAADATIGSSVETDAALRLRREDELDAQGAGTVDTIRDALVRDVAGIVSAHVFENTTMVTDANGLPPKSLRAVIYDGATPQADDDEVAQLLWDKKPGGIEYTGATSGTAVDSEGSDRIVPFARATVKNVWFDYVLTVDADYPADGDDQVKAAAVALGAELLTLGADVIAARFKAAAFEVAGVVDVTTFELGFAASPSGTTNLTVASGEIAVLDTSRITVTT